jgi:hypothetical protein
MTMVPAPDTLPSLSHPVLMAPWGDFYDQLIEEEIWSCTIFRQLQQYGSLSEIPLKTSDEIIFLKIKI